jgi:hypothetical protein
MGLNGFQLSFLLFGKISFSFSREQFHVSLRATSAMTCKLRPPNLICSSNRKKIDVQNLIPTPARNSTWASIFYVDPTKPILCAHPPDRRRAPPPARQPSPPSRLCPSSLRPPDPRRARSVRPPARAVLAAASCCSGGALATLR